MKKEHLIQVVKESLKDFGKTLHDAVHEMLQHPIRTITTAALMLALTSCPAEPTNKGGGKNDSGGLKITNSHELGGCGDRQCANHARADMADIGHELFLEGMADYFVKSGAINADNTYYDNVANQTMENLCSAYGCSEAHRDEYMPASYTSAASLSFNARYIAGSGEYHIVQQVGGSLHRYDGSSIGGGVYYATNTEYYNDVENRKFTVWPCFNATDRAAARAAYEAYAREQHQKKTRTINVLSYDTSLIETVTYECGF